MILLKWIDTPVKKTLTLGIDEDQIGNNDRNAAQETMSSALSKGFDSFGEKLVTHSKDEILRKNG
jgi:hypothetical protein